MTKDDLDRIIRRDMPGYRVARGYRPEARKADVAADAPAAAATPSLDTLRQKYLVSKYLSRDSDWQAARSDAARSVESHDERAKADEEDIIVPVEPEQAVDPWDVGARPKAVVISGREGRVIGHQG